ncbi:putative aminopeptidase FrvX [Sedimentibacter acidaminivorans]|uniref:Aminopeptidase FrvX n=1 Tax=Sedimentibacter acidaminivorans TaxID=913099 RepID=A0ABS4GFT4_9FIRM|nr:M42 family metallopeptidase [Sedimentibacter acidaminivorans]MBP1926560.1 putative aminopeptidase FrvX [Sedimentibacter acidaminivorans]
MVKLNREFTINTLEEIINIPSPSGYCKNIVGHIESISKNLGCKFEKNNKGNLILEIEGKDNSYCVGIPVHVDTLGAMVRSVNSDGTLRISTIGGNIFSTLDGEYCNIHTRCGKIYTGTILCNSPSIHVYPDAAKKERIEENMMVRLDEIVSNKSEVEKLNIMTGDFISVEPKFQITKSGFVKSRYLDNKAGTACALSIIEVFKRLNEKPNYKVKIIISTYEEVGHGCSNIPEDIDELIGIDMGCVGLDLACTEREVSICPKDGSGPYDYDITSKLIEIAKINKLGYAVDIYPMYSSDVSASLKGGNNVKGGLIGPGVNASHGMERTHIDGIENTIKLIYLYLTD